MTRLLILSPTLFCVIRSLSIKADAIIHKGQSVHHALVVHQNILRCSEKTLYRRIEKGIYTTKLHHQFGANLEQLALMHMIKFVKVIFLVLKSVRNIKRKYAR